MCTIGQRIKKRRLEKRLTQKAVAQFVGKSASAVTQWELDATQPNGENLLKLSKLLECSPEWLLSGKNGFLKDPESCVIPSGLRTTKLPILSWVQAGDWNSDEPVENYKNDFEWVETALRLSSRAFALRIKGDSMTSPYGMSIPEGSIVIVEPDIHNIADIQGKIVIAQLGGSGETTIKRLTRDGDDYYLLPFNPAFRSLRLDESCRIVGVVKQIVIDL